MFFVFDGLACPLNACGNSGSCNRGTQYDWDTKEHVHTLQLNCWLARLGIVLPFYHHESYRRQDLGAAAQQKRSQRK